MIKEALATAVIVTSGLAVATHAGQQITDSPQHLIWLWVGAGSGAALAVLRRTQDATPAWRRFASALIAGPVMGVLAFHALPIPLIADLTYAVGAGMAYVSWHVLPILLRKETITGIISWASGLIGGRRNG